MGMKAKCKIKKQGWQDLNITHDNLAWLFLFKNDLQLAAFCLSAGQKSKLPACCSKFWGRIVILLDSQRRKCVFILRR